MGIIYADEQVSGIETFQEYLFELINDTKYELRGPRAVYCREDWEDMDEEDRQMELDQWEPPTEQRAAELEIRDGVLNEIWKLADKTIGTLYNRAASQRHEYNRRRPHDPAYPSSGEIRWRKRRG